MADPSPTADDGKAVTDTRYTYDELGRLKTVSVVERDDTPITSEETTYYYDLAGNLKDIAQSDGVTTDYTYDDLNRLTSVIHFVDDNVNFAVDSGETLLAEFDYVLNTDGTKASETDTDDDDNTATYS